MAVVRSALIQTFGSMSMEENVERQIKLIHQAAEKGAQITCLQELATGPEWGGGVYGVVFRGRRYDTGDRLDYLKAIVQLASDRDDLGPEFRPWLRDFAATLTNDDEHSDAP